MPLLWALRELLDLSGIPSMPPESRSPGWNLDHSYATLPGVFHTRVHPTAVRAPRLVVLNHALASDLGLDLAALPDAEAAALFAGNVLPAGAEPLAQAPTNNDYRDPPAHPNPGYRTFCGT